MKKSLQEKISEVSAFTQINKSFRHVHGEPAATIIAALVYKYTYWDSNGKLKSRITSNGNILKSFYISKLDLSLESGISISRLEKKDKSNPLVLLESLQMIKLVHNELTNKSDEFVILPNNILLRMKQASIQYAEDIKAINSLSRSNQRRFLKALNGELSRKEVYFKFAVNDQKNKIEIEDDLNDLLHSTSDENIIFPNEENSSPDKKDSSFSEGISNKVNRRSSNKVVKNKDTYHDVFKNDELLFDDTSPDKPNKYSVTIETIAKGIQDYVWGNIKEIDLHTMLKNYIPDNIGMNWKMTYKDESYIRTTLSSIGPGYLNGALEYIETNVKKMISGDRRMRFGSILVGINRKVREAGVGYDDSRLPQLTKKEYDTVSSQIQVDNDIDILVDL